MSRRSLHELASTFGPHLASVCARTAQALAACGFGSLLVHSGRLLAVFEDDRTYPFEAHAPFKVWAPLSDAPDSFVWFEPGARPRLILHRPPDYWYKPAELPEGYWVEHFDMRTRRRPRRGTGAAAAGPVAQRPTSGTRSPELAAWGPAAINPPAAHAAAGLCPRGEDPLRARVPARGEPPGRARTPRRGARLSPGASEFEIELAFLRACGLREQELPYNPIIALNAGGAVLHYQVLEKHAPRASGYSLLIDAGAEFARLCVRHHAHLLSGRCRLRGAHRPRGPHAAGAVRAGARRGRLARRAPARPCAHRASCCARPTSSAAASRRPSPAASPACSCRMASGTCSGSRCTTSAALWLGRRAGRLPRPTDTRTCA